MIANNMSYVEPKTSMLTREDIIQNQSMLVSKANNSRMSNSSMVPEPKIESMIINAQKA